MAFNTGKLHAYLFGMQKSQALQIYWLYFKHYCKKVKQVDGAKKTPAILTATLCLINATY